MRIIIYQKAGEDYPAQFKGNEKYLDASKAAIIRRLELRPQDTVEIIEESDVTDIPKTDIRSGIAFLYRDGIKEAKKVFGEHFTCKLDIAPHGEDFEIAVIPMTFPSDKWDNVQVCISQHPAIFMAAHLRIGDKKVLTIRTGSGTVGFLWARVETIAKDLELGVKWQELLTDNAFRNVAKLIEEGWIEIYSYDEKGCAVKEA